MTALAVEQLTDPLVSAVLGLAKAAVNAVVTSGIVETTGRPLTAATVSALPVLACYRIRQQGHRRVFGYMDHDVTLRLHYVSSEVAIERLAARWPVLERVWREAFKSISKGYFASYQSGANVLEDAGAVWVNEAYTKLESYFSDGSSNHPQFEADIQISWRDLEGIADELAPLFDVASLESTIEQVADGEDVTGIGHDVVVRSLVEP